MDKWLKPAVVLAVAGALASGCAHQSVAPPPSSARAPAPLPAQPAAVARVPEPAAAQSAPAQPATDEHALQSVLYFGFDEDVLTEESLGKLRKVAEVLRASPSTKIRIAGNCDERGTTEYNIVLGQRRAAVARKYLIDLGVEPKQIDVVSYGAERPADPGHGTEAWAANRRDEFERL